MAPDISRARRGRRVGAASLAVAALAGTFVASGAAHAATSTTAASVTFGGMQPAWATASADRGQVASGTAVTSTIYLAAKDQAGMEAYAEAVSTPGNALYHKYLSASQYQARFGTTAAQISAVESWLRSSGLKVASANSHEIQVSGSAAQTESTYGLSLHNYSVKGKTYRAPAGSAHLPAAVAADVLSVGSLSTMPLTMAPAGAINTTATEDAITGAKPTMGTTRDGATYVGQEPCSSYYGQAVDTTAPAQGGKENPYVLCGYSPQQLRSAYGVDGVTGKGVTVAIVDAYGSSDILSDANTYAKYQGDPAFKPGQFLDTETPADFYDYADCGGPADWSPEEHIDVEAVHAMAPAATVHYYGGNSCQNADLLVPLQQIVDTHSADIVSDSWGSVVFSSAGNLTAADKDAYDQTLMQGAIEGIEINFSTGDCGAEDPTTGCGANDTSTVPQADWPDTDPWVTAVGGTSTAIGKHGNVLWDTSWGTDIYLPPTTAGSGWSYLEWYFGGGGGTSAIFSQPWYQRGVVSKTLATTLPDGTRTTSAMRTVPDVSMDADPYTGFLIGLTTTLPDGTTGVGVEDYGGTSLASPLFAGLQADAIQVDGGRRIGFANPAIYAEYGTGVYTDVTGKGPGTKAYNDMPADDGTDATNYSVGFGDDQLLTATPGYDDATGVGTPNTNYLWARLGW
ncbi:S8/S53 family peptidase [Actinospica durhamensis]|uniref:S8/S53 family peptidase n=1 Tax=Actinospica durhamensis TaxID=1508375 RepID=A0A941EXZ9_9ACTN|nr:S53 family peptidase [Actinospica durhamensis]MBR7839296.1 S8/S53 family peptidase [Actinospica durhamensis]